LIRPGAARAAHAARQEHLDRDSIAGSYSPASGRVRPDLFDDPDRLVTGDEGVAGKEVARELLVVRPTQAARFDAQQAVVGADRGERELA
jgi:hypothetical protein